MVLRLGLSQTIDQHSTAGNFHTNFNLLFNDAAVNLSFSFRTPSISCLELTVNQGLMCVSKRKKGKDRSVTYLISLSQAWFSSYFLAAFGTLNTFLPPAPLKIEISPGGNS